MASCAGTNFPAAWFVVVFQCSLYVARRMVVVIVQYFSVDMLCACEKISGLAMAKIHIGWAAALYSFRIKVSHVDICDFVKIKPLGRAG